ncbi:hypothetical protein ABW20_dc0103491 [Dactylellina cionopaga]|nr:hypothetical protein ABW20_dc0103491 [Dactylellina cionopaga]
MPIEEHNILCKHFTKGRCSRGESCRFSHDIDLLKNVKIIEVDVSDLFRKSTNGWVRPPSPSSKVDPEALAYQKYQHPATPAAQILSFKDVKQYHKSRLVPGITHIQYANGFPVTNDHINDLLSVPQILADLEVLMIKGIDVATISTPGKKRKKKETVTTNVQEINISSEPLISVIRSCPSLKLLHLVGCIDIDDIVFKEVMENCLEINEIRITGTPTQPGCITTTSLIYLITRGSGLGADLREINLTNQVLDLRAVTVLSDARPEITITEGVQVDSKNGGIGMSLNDADGTFIHSSGYVVGRDGVSFKYKDCYWPSWESEESKGKGDLGQILVGSEGPEGFWSDEEKEAGGDRMVISPDLGGSSDDEFDEDMAATMRSLRELKIKEMQIAAARVDNRLEELE